MRLDHLLSMENMRDYHESFTVRIVSNTREWSADTEQSAELIVVQFSVTERSVAFLTYWRIAQVVRARA